MKKTIAIVGLLASAPLWAAEGLSYNYLQVDYVADSELDVTLPGVGSGSTDGDGFVLGGVFSINETFYVLADYSDIGYDGSLDLEEISVGVGGHSNAFTGAIDVFGNLTYENIDIGGVGDDDGFGAEIGARALLMDALDGYISYKYGSIGDVDSNFFKLGGSYALTPNWAVVAEYRTGDYEDDSNAELDRDDLRIGARYNF